MGQGARSGKRDGSRLDLWIALALVLTILTAYGQMYRFEFINLDDQVYVVENGHVKSGLKLENAVWAFIFRDPEFQTYWHPLTWLSHMLDCQLFGLNAGGHHLTNMALHIANSLLLFFVFRRMTGARWRSAFVAALFALHPLNVESVAWVAERKNVLSTLFWLLTMAAYARYAERPVLSRYLLTFLFFLLGLMAKPMLVTLPFVMLLLDFWPLGRLQSDRLSIGLCARDAVPSRRWPVPVRLAVEKIPFLMLSLASLGLSSSGLRSYGSLVTTGMVSMQLRIFNAVVTYVKYILKILWPHDLAVLYPFPEVVPLWQVIGAAIFLIAVSAAVLRARRNRPYLAFGWFWYLGVLVPACGLVQAGLWPEMADRWAYVPQIGLFVMAAWGGAEWAVRLRQSRAIVAGASLFLGLLLVMTVNQGRYWQNSIRLFEHTLAVTERNETAHLNLGEALERQAREVEAMEQYQQALKINPRNAEVHNNMGGVMSRQGFIGEAIAHFRAALEINRRHAPAHYNLAKALYDQGLTSEAIYHYSEAVRINPRFVKAYNNLGNALAVQGRIREAVGYYLEALAIDPEDPAVYSNLRKVVLDLPKGDLLLKKITGGLRIETGNMQGLAETGAHRDLVESR